MERKENKNHMRIEIRADKKSMAVHGYVNVVARDFTASSRQNWSLY